MRADMKGTLTNAALKQMLTFQTQRRKTKKENYLLKVKRECNQIAEPVVFPIGLNESQCKNCSLQAQLRKAQSKDIERVVCSWLHESKNISNKKCCFKKLHYIF